MHIFSALTCLWQYVFTFIANSLRVIRFDVASEHTELNELRLLGASNRPFDGSISNLHGIIRQISTSCNCKNLMVSLLNFFGDFAFGACSCIIILTQCVELTLYSNCVTYCRPIQFKVKIAICWQFYTLFNLLPECYTTFWMMTICSDNLHWSGITPIFDSITDLDLITEFDFLPNCERFP